LQKINGIVIYNVMYIFLKYKNKESLLLSISACFLVFLAGQIGALQNILGGHNSYVVRLFLISVGFFLCFVAAFNNTKHKYYDVSSIVISIFYFISISLSMLFNPDSKLYAIYQAFGLMFWVLFGVFIAKAVNRREERIFSIIFGYLSANIFFVLLTGVYLITNFHNNFNVVNGRLVGPFDGSTVVSEIFFSSLLFGLMLIYWNYNLTGGIISLFSLMAIYLTGVRSAIVITCIVLTMYFVIYIKSIKRDNQLILTLFSLVTIISTLISFLYLKDSDILSRFRWGYILNEGRIQIWLVGIDILERGSLLFGKGVRAEFITELPMYEDYYKIAIAWHNTWLAILIETGIVGLISYSLILMIGLKRLYKLYMSFNALERQQNILISCMIYVCLRYIFMSFTEMNLYTALSPGVMFFCIIFGVFSVKET
jgi:O-Antigen ligase